MGKDLPLKKIKNWIQCFERFELEELTIEEGHTHIRIQRTIRSKTKRKKIKGPKENPVSLQKAHQASTTKEKSQEKEQTKEYEEKQYERIASPMTGVFYRSPGPEMKVFVREGQRVHANDTLCIIEAMKIMNELKAEKPGDVIRVLVEDSQTVQKGQALFLFEPL